MKRVLKDFGVFYFIIYTSTCNYLIINSTGEGTAGEPR